MVNQKADGDSCFWWLCALFSAPSAIFCVITAFKMYLKREGINLSAAWGEQQCCQ